MGYYHIPLDEYSQNLCTTTLPLGKFKCKMFPKVLVSMPDVFQEVMHFLLENPTVIFVVFLEMRENMIVNRQTRVCDTRTQRL